MLIYEVGIMFRGYPLIFSNNCHIQQNKVDGVLRSGILNSIFEFIQATYSEPLTEYVENKDFFIAFTKEKISGHDVNEHEDVIGYAILDKKKKMDKYISKYIIPSLEIILKKFIDKNNGKDLLINSDFESFKTTLNDVFTQK